MKVFYVFSVFALIVQFAVFCNSYKHEGRSLRVRRDAVNKIETVSQAVDVALRETRFAMKRLGMEPFKAPNQSESVFVGYLTMTNIRVYNLSTIRRVDEVKVFDNPDKRTLTFQVKLTFDDMQVISDYKASVMLIASIGKVTAKIPEVVVDFTLQIDFKALEAKMTNFKITKNDSEIKVKFSGNIESVGLNLITPLATRILGNLILFIIQGTVKKEINRILDIANKIIQESIKSIGNKN